MTLDELVQAEHEAGCLYGPFHQRWIREKMARAPESVLRDLEMARRHPNLVAGRQGFASMDVNDVNTASFGAINTSLAELNIIGNTQANIDGYAKIAPNDAKAGKMYRVAYGGTYGNTGTPTLTVTPRWGSSTTPSTNVLLGASRAWTTITGTTGLEYYGQFDFGIRTAPPGATAGTGVGTGTTWFGIPVTSSQIAAPVLMGNTVGTIDTTGLGTAGCGLTINFTWSVSSASNTSTCLWYIVRSLN